MVSFDFGTVYEKPRPVRRPARAGSLPHADASRREPGLRLTCVAQRARHRKSSPRQAFRHGGRTASVDAHDVGMGRVSGTDSLFEIRPIHRQVYLPPNSRAGRSIPVALAPATRRRPPGSAIGSRRRIHPAFPVAPCSPIGVTVMVALERAGVKESRRRETKPNAI